MNTIIHDDELVRYVTDQLSKNERKRIERDAIQSGQADVLLHATLANYCCKADLADDLLGADTFEQKTKRTKRDSEEELRLKPAACRPKMGRLS